jgi:hypothetical protein
MWLKSVIVVTLLEFKSEWTYMWFRGYAKSHTLDLLTNDTLWQTIKVASIQIGRIGLVIRVEFIGFEATKLEPG